MDLSNSALPLTGERVVRKWKADSLSMENRYRGLELDVEMASIRFWELSSQNTILKSLLNKEVHQREFAEARPRDLRDEDISRIVLVKKVCRASRRIFEQFSIIVERQYTTGFQRGFEDSSLPVWNHHYISPNVCDAQHGIDPPGFYVDPSTHPEEAAFEEANDALAIVGLSDEEDFAGTDSAGTSSP